MKNFYVAFIATLFVFGSNAQTLQGNAAALPPSLPGSTDYQLTPALTFQRGAYWNNTQLNLANNFSISAELNFGSQTGTDAQSADFSTGADGIAFVLQSIGTSVLGDVGEGMGYNGLTNSFAVEMDTWQNTNQNDPVSDHLAFMKNGDATHNTAANSNTDRYLLADLENGNWHPITIAWNAGTQTMTVTLDGVARSFTGNIAAMIGTASVTWGFTAATGAAVNFHRVRFLAPVCAPFTVTATLPSLGCSEGNTIYLGYGPQSITATSSPADPTTVYKWYMMGSPNTPVSMSATFTPTEAGTYYVVATRGVCKASTMGNPALVTTVIDIRCGKENQNKVYVCHKENGTHGNGTIGENAHTLCVSVNAVPAHLAHGDCLGACETSGFRGNAEFHNTIQEKLEGLSVYPNPTTNSVRVNLETGSATSEIIVRNAQGNIVERKKVNGNAVQSFDLRKYGTGVFMIQVLSGANITTNKVLVKE